MVHRIHKGKRKEKEGIAVRTLFEIAKNSDINVEYCRVPENTSLSAPVLGKCYIAMDYSLINKPKDERVCLAHELGHCETKSFYSIYAKCDIRGRHEVRADRWAIRHLVPKDALGVAVRNGITELWELADYFQVTEPFMRKAVEYYKMLETA